MYTRTTGNGDNAETRTTAVSTTFEKRLERRPKEQQLEGQQIERRIGKEGYS